MAVKCTQCGREAAGQYLAAEGPEDRCEEHMPGLVRDLRPGHPKLRKCDRCAKRKPEPYYFLDSTRAFCKACRAALML